METLPLLILIFFLIEFLVAIGIHVATPFEVVRKLLSLYGLGVVAYVFFAFPMFWVWWNFGPGWLAYGYYLGVPIALVCLHTFAVILHLYLRKRTLKYPPKFASQEKVD